MHAATVRGCPIAPGTLGRAAAVAAAGRPLLPGAHDRVITAQVIAGLARTWDGPPLRLELTGPAGGRRTPGSGPPAATIQAGTADHLRTPPGRHDHPGLHDNGDTA